MITLPSLKLNNTVQETIPSPAELFARFGYSSKHEGAMSGDEVVPTGQSKVEMAAEVEKIALEKE